MQRRPDRVLGPYGPDSRGCYRVISITAGARTSATFKSKSEADEAIDAARLALQEAEETTVAQAIERYKAQLLKKGRTQDTADTTDRFLTYYFKAVLDKPIARLTTARCVKLYQDLQNTPTRFGRPPSANTHRQSLMQAKALLTWAVREKLHRGPSPAQDIEPEGRIHRGKPQLRIDEARKWRAEAEKVVWREPGAAMALTCLLLGLRPGECANLTVRDLDDAGAILWVKGKAKPLEPPVYRPVEVCADLVDILLHWAKDKLPAALLFGPRRKAVSYWVRRICELAEVPIPEDDWRRLCGHSLRGMHATYARQAGATSHLVSGALGNTPAVLESNYVAAGTQEAADRRRAQMKLVR